MKCLENGSSLFSMLVAAGRKGREWFKIEFSIDILQEPESNIKQPTLGYCIDWRV